MDGIDLSCLTFPSPKNFCVRSPENLQHKIIDALDSFLEELRQEDFNVTNFPVDANLSNGASDPECMSENTKNISQCENLSTNPYNYHHTARNFVPRRSARLRAQPQYLKDIVCYMSCSRLKMTSQFLLLKCMYI